MLTVNANQGGFFFFLNAPDGTGKTFLIPLILANIRSQGIIASETAPSGIAASSLDGGRTAHSAVKLPLNVHNNPNAMFGVKKNQNDCSHANKFNHYLEWTCTIAHKHPFEA